MIHSKLSRVRFICAHGLLLAMIACAPFSAEIPEGFAAFDGRGTFRAASSDGVTYRVRHEDNSPEADLKFWSEALKKRMDDAGYTFINDGEVKASGQTGYLLELAAPLGQRDYIYMIGLFVLKDDLVLVESAGEASKITDRRQAILTAMERIKFHG